MIVTKRTSGRFVTEDKDMITQIRTQLAKEEALSFIEKMKELGFEKNDILALLSAVAEEPAEQRRERA